MNKSISLVVLLTSMLVVVGCSEPESSLVTPDAEFYEKGIEAAKNGPPPGASGPQTGRFKAEPPRSAAVDGG
ncbi:hypothetical protein [Allorhodopirellula solitaria]|uniref:Uncharacterized protein n=1 Tax=Allorhodopirellula solitaria TaxID=2527987 RepID=A0A5C5XXT8_9BACT|nr:hypothetical protein [Allorhodopirellula solitaria]TWT67331.1 hypothetical protein CA85_21810 [Allorhodopirellula solitaria]